GEVTHEHVRHAEGIYGVVDEVSLAEAAGFLEAIVIELDGGVVVAGVPLDIGEGERGEGLDAGVGRALRALDGLTQDLGAAVIFPLERIHDAEIVQSQDQAVLVAKLGPTTTGALEVDLSLRDLAEVAERDPEVVGGDGGCLDGAHIVSYGEGAAQG